MTDVPPSVVAMADDGQAPTSDFDEFVAVYNTDDNWWWRISCGHHMNLFDEAVDRIETALREHQPADFEPEMCVTCYVKMPCPTLLALKGDAA